MAALQVSIIPATRRPGFIQATGPARAKLRVAAYCRVSSDDAEQLLSYTAQVSHYDAFIKQNDQWEFAGIYADEAISATNTKKRLEFHRLIDDCMAGKIDYVITKSVSRFARNTIDCLNYTRKLRDKNIPVFFEKENIISTDTKGELLLTIMASIAQEESRSTSQNVKMGFQYRFQKGEMQINHNRFLGYTKGPDKRLVIVPEEAAIVKRIYREYLEGASLLDICRGLEANGVLTGAGLPKWRPETVKGILQNEKYVGDALLQKTYTIDFLQKKRVKNCEIVPQYYVENCHEAIIPRNLYTQVQQEMTRRSHLCGTKNSTKRNYSSRYALSGIVICGECGEIYRRIHWNNRGKKSIVWRCVSRLNGKSSKCASRTISEEDLQAAVTAAINQLISDRDEFRSVLSTNIETVMNSEEDHDIGDIEAKLGALQNEILQLASSSSEYDNLADEIHRLRSLKQGVHEEKTQRQTKQQRTAEMKKFLEAQSGMLTEYDDKLTRQLVHRVELTQNAQVVEFRSGVMIEIDIQTRKIITKSDLELAWLIKSQQ